MKYIFPMLLVFVIFDFFWNLNEIYNQPIQGDIVPLVLPDDINAPVLKDPFGFKALQSRTYHPNINRFFSTTTLYTLFHSVPFFFQKFTHPVESIYLTAALFKSLIYLGYLIFLTRIVIGKKASRNDWILGFFIITPFMQIGGYLGNIALVGSSIVYECYYGFPFLLLLIWALPFFDSIRAGKYQESKLWKVFLLLGLTVFCSFSSALMPGVILIGGMIYFLHFLWTNWKVIFIGEKFVSLARLVNYQHLLLLTFMILSIYSYYLGGFNSESVDQISVGERYQKLGSGVLKYFLSIPSLPIIWITIILNLYLLNRNEIRVWGKPFGKFISTLGIFIIIYILLLPLGGYRSYRELILRSDMLIPTTILVFFLVSLSSYTLLKKLTGKALRNYSIYFFLLVFIFSFYDYGSFPSGKACESDSLHRIAETDQNLLHLEERCRVMDWEKVSEPNYYKNHAKLWQYWNITDHEVLISMPNN